MFNAKAIQKLTNTWRNSTPQKIEEDMDPNSILTSVIGSPELVTRLSPTSPCSAIPWTASIIIRPELYFKAPSDIQKLALPTLLRKYPKYITKLVQMWSKSSEPSQQEQSSEPSQQEQQELIFECIGRDKTLLADFPKLEIPEHLLELWVSEAITLPELELILDRASKPLSSGLQEVIAMAFPLEVKRLTMETYQRMAVKQNWRALGMIDWQDEDLVVSAILQLPCGKTMPRFTSYLPAQNLLALDPSNFFEQVLKIWSDKIGTSLAYHCPDYYIVLLNKQSDEWMRLTPYYVQIINKMFIEKFVVMVKYDKFVARFKNSPDWDDQILKSLTKLPISNCIEDIPINTVRKTFAVKKLLKYMSKNNSLMMRWTETEPEVVSVEDHLINMVEKAKLVIGVWPPIKENLSSCSICMADNVLVLEKYCGGTHPNEDLCTECFEKVCNDNGNCPFCRTQLNSIINTFNRPPRRLRDGIGTNFVDLITSLIFT